MRDLRGNRTMAYDGMDRLASRHLALHPRRKFFNRREDVMSDTIDTARREPTVFVAHEEAHFELCKLRAYLRLRSRSWIQNPSA